MRKIIAAALAIVMISAICPAFFATDVKAENGNTISLAEINGADLTPIADETPEEHLAYSLDDDANYTVFRHYWRDETENTSYFTIFVRENTYRCCFELAPNEGYNFTKDTAVFLNGSQDNVSAVEVMSNGNLRVWSLFSVAGMGWPDGYLFYDDFENYNPKWWARFDLDFDGECFDKGSKGDGFKVYEGDFCLIDRTANPLDENPDFREDSISSHAFTCADGAVLSWYHCSQNTTEPEPYTVCIQMAESPLLWDLIEVWDGTAPMDYEKVEVDLSEYAGKDIRIVIQHHGEVEDGVLCIDLLTVKDTAFTYIDSVNIKKAQVYPVIGESPADNYYYSPDADKHYTVTNHYWYDETAHTKNFDKFEQGHEYSSCFVLTPHEHYYLSVDTAVTVNGEATGLKVINTDGSLSFRVKNTAMTELPIISGDVDDDFDITTADATLILKITIESISPTDRQKIAADVNGNGKITTADATCVLKKVAGK